MNVNKRMFEKVSLCLIVMLMGGGLFGLSMVSANANANETGESALETNIIKHAENKSLSNTTTQWVQTNGPYGGIIGNIEIDPSNPDILYAGGTGGGVFKTTDRGASWTMLEKIGPTGDEISNILISSDDPETIYAMCIGVLFKSTDGGENWRDINGELRFNCVKMNPTNPLVLIAGTYDGKLYRSVDAGESWRKITGGGLSGDGISDIGIGGSNEFWVGTSNRVDGRLYHTTNGGASWNEVDFKKPKNTDIHSIYVDPGRHLVSGCIQRAWKRYSLCNISRR